MKIKTIILLVLVLIFAGGAAYANHDLDELKDHMNYSLETVSGDPTLLDGTELSLTGGINYQMKWTSSLKIHEGELSEEKTDFSIDSNFGGIGYETMDPRRTSINIRNSASEEMNDFMENGTYYYDWVKELGVEMLTSDKSSFVFKLKDYMEYYPLSGSIQIGAGSQDLAKWDNKKIQGWSMKYPSRSTKQEFKENMKGFMDFFKIPVLEDEKYEFEITSGDITEKEVNISEGPSDFFELDFSSVFQDDKVYLYFDDRTENGNIVDTSKIPGGYGIYAFDYKITGDSESKYKMDMSTLKNVMPLDPETKILKIEASLDGKHIKVFTAEKDRVILRVMDTDSLVVTDEKILWDDLDTDSFKREMYSEDHDHWKLIFSDKDLGMEEKGLSLVNLPENEGVILVKDEGDRADILFKGSFDPGHKPYEEGTRLGPDTETKFSWDGDRLVIAAIRGIIKKDEPISELNTVIVYALDKEGNCFAGEIKGDLTRVLGWYEEPEDYYEYWDDFQDFEEEDINDMILDYWYLGGRVTMTIDDVQSE